MKIKIPFLLACGVLSSNVLAFEPFVIKDIRVEGIQRTEAGTVFNYLPVKVGDTFDDHKAAQSIRALFATGFFSDVKIDVNQNVVEVLVNERPAISSIDFVGLKEFPKDVILKALKEVGIAQGRIFDRSQMEKAEQELKRQYLSKGRYGVQITTTITPQERNRVGLNFQITEGAVAKIRQIAFVGNNEFSDKELLNLLTLTTPDWLSWYTKNDQYSRQKLSADLETLKSFYMDQGYLEFNVDSTQVALSPNKQDVFITINLTEGARFQVSDVRLMGDIPIEDEELKKLVVLKAGDIFSRKNLNASTKAIADRLGEVGYAFANVNASPEMDKEQGKVAFTIFVDPGKRVYVRNINIAGNTRTRDEVIRREIRQMESAWYDASSINLSKERVDRLGYFTETTVETKPVEGTADQVDLNLKVKEKPTGNLMFGIGTSNIDRIILSASLSQDNFLGSGNTVGFTIDSSRSQRTYDFSYTNPYFTIDGISQGFDIYHRSYDTSKTYNTIMADYKTASTGGAVRFGFPISEQQNINVGIGIDSTEVDTYDSSPQYYKDYVNRVGKTNLTFPLMAEWVSDSRNRRFFATKGVLQRLGAEVAVPGSDLKYYRVGYQWQGYWPLNKRFTLMFNTEWGYANGYGGDHLPFYKNFYAGGAGSVRGYQANSLGPKIADTYGDYFSIGGKAKAVGNAEVLWALPGLEETVRMAWFVDAGQIYADNNSSAYNRKKDNALRYSTGLALSWISPIGPLRLSFAVPLNKQDGDEIERFQFQFGSAF